MKKVANYNISLKVFLQNNKGETLILKTPDTSSFHGKYDFPGGRIDENEFYLDLLDILHREIIEEVGNIKYKIVDKVVAVARHRAQYENHKEDIFYPFYEAKILDGDIHISHEHNNFLWVKLDEIVLEDYFESGMLDAAKMYLNK
ncbi:MAG: NUDIX domain-containing protein [Candidatus Gracilibacteria bacterium]|nr:NUDIX domain-containing protein [Candidatus Gracilibacteria bacterium]